MSIRIGVTKQISAGEQIVLDVLQINSITGEVMYPSLQDMITVLDEGRRHLDIIAGAMMERVLSTSQLRQYCTPEEWEKVSGILDVVSGRMTSDDLAYRWYAKKEETEALEEGRREAARMAEHEAQLAEMMGDGVVYEGEQHHV